MITAMAAQQQVYTVPAYGGLEAYAQYPQYVTQVSVSCNSFTMAKIFYKIF